MARCRRNRLGFSLIEVVISTLLVGLVVVAAMRCMGGILSAQVITSEAIRGEQLAHQLLSEIMNDAYLDEGASPLFGPEESTTSRSGFDDVDDYHLWSARPPQDRNGVPFANMAGWQRDVLVEWVDPADPASVSNTDLGVKRITVIVKLNDDEVASLVSLRGEDYP